MTLLMFFLLQMNIHITKHKIVIDDVQYDIIERKLLVLDTLYYCPNDVVFRRHDDALYYYKQGEYKKYKL
jgi:hypothetical protein